ncbi:MAG: helix-turn-helix transcriptional regulator [Paludibacteraceae bacterium]|nr:helix-turn-helix transcriptional regulator [Paludibacteraceae bacterium]
MSVLMSSAYEALQIISRFGLPLGVGEKTIAEVCRENNIDPTTFLSVINHETDKAVDVPTLMVYLNNAHRYFLNYLLPRIRQELITAISSVKTGSNIPLLIIQLYDEYVEEVRTHIAHETANEFSAHISDDQHLAAKMSELKNLIIKYYPSDEQNELLFAALHDICLIEKELALHCTIEDDILLPALQRNIDRQTKQQAESVGEELSPREKDVLVEVVNGLSNKEIADKLNISTHTVISHRKNIARKLDIHSTAGLTIYAIVNKLVELESATQG